MDQAEQALAQFQVVTQSALIADVDGRIGMVVTGRIPMRDRTNDLHAASCRLQDGMRATTGSAICRSENAPRMRDPAAGLIVTANHKIVPSTYPHHLTYDWFLPYRAQRVEQLLNARAKHDVTTFKAIQADITSFAARDMLWMLQRSSACDRSGAGCT